MRPGKLSKVGGNKLLNWKVAGVVFIAFISYLPALNNSFVNWDDIVYVLNNNMITSFSFENTRKIFSSFFMGNYHPFTILSLSIDYFLFDFNAPGYHVHSVLLHLLNTFFVYTFFYKLLLKDVNLSVIVALIFAVHPMHVESVAWVSERKDLLYTLYFLLALIVYLSYLNTKSWTHYLLCYLLFLFALLSKAQAVTLPIVLLLLDYVKSRGFTVRSLVEKLPFFIASLAFGIVAIIAQQDSNYINPLNMPFWQSLLYGPYSLWIYLWKFIFPVYLTSLYEYPLSSNGSLPLYIYFSPFVFLLMLYIIWYTWKRDRLITFGLLLFLTTIFPVLQFLPVGKALVAERYTYLPYIGLGLIIGHLYFKFNNVFSKSQKNIISVVGLALILFFIYQTYNRTKIWKDSISLWTDVLEKNPGSVTASMNLAFLFNMEKQYEKAVDECTKSLEFDSTNYLVYKNRAIAFKNMGKFQLALSDYSKAINFNPHDSELYLFRGIIYTDKMQMFDSGIVDFRKYLQFYPKSEKANFNLSVAWFNKNNFDSSLFYCRKVLKINPDNRYAANLFARLDTLMHEKNRK